MTNLNAGPKSRVDAFTTKLDEAGVTMEDADLVLQETYLAKVMADELHRVIALHTYSPAKDNASLGGSGFLDGRRVTVKELVTGCVEERGRIIGAYKYFKKNPGQVPDGWRGASWIFFPDSEFVDDKKRRCVRYGYWSDKRWHWGVALFSDVLKTSAYVVMPNW